MSAGASSSSVPRAARWLFIAYLCVLFVLTHWPRLEIPVGAIDRPDFLAHLIAFGLWAFLCVRAGWFGPRNAARNILLAAIVCLLYISFDEGTQAIPWIQRDAAWDDLAGDLLGVGLGLGVASLLAAIDDDRSDSTHGER